MLTYGVTDLRTPRRRAQQQAPAGDLEGFAARIVAFTTDQQVVIQDDGRRDAMPDLRIDYRDRPPASWRSSPRWTLPTDGCGTRPFELRPCRYPSSIGSGTSPSRPPVTRGS